MSKNLDVSKFRNGEAIPFAKTDAEWELAAKKEQPAYCYYENKTANGTKYGKLYNWFAVKDPRGLAPNGYHIPFMKEWIYLRKYLDAQELDWKKTSGTKMKSKTGWEYGNGTNSIGFNGLPGGFTDGFSREAKVNGYWWSFSVYGTNSAYGVCLSGGNELEEKHSYMEYGYSVRCLRNRPLHTTFSKKAQDVTIGTQTWTSKNLNVSTYRNGDTIPEVQDKNAWAKLKTGAWCYYENKTANGTTYGKLYNCYAVNDSRGLAPIGYHLPTDAEWTILTDYLGGESVANSKMKSTSRWNSFDVTKPCNVCKDWTDGYREGKEACKACANWTEDYQGGNTCKLCKDTKIINAAKHNCSANCIASLPTCSTEYSTTT
jgi:uncharacterized protein (TIGR02145 family)